MTNYIYNCSQKWANALCRPLERRCDGRRPHSQGSDTIRPRYGGVALWILVSCWFGPEANIINEKHDILGIFIPCFRCKIWDKNTQYIVLCIYNIGLRIRWRDGAGSGGALDTSLVR